MSATGIPRLDAYIGALPRGLESYPDHVMKGSVIRGSLEAMPLAPHAARLPPVLAELVTRKIPHSQWVPEVHGEALHETMRDLLFPDDDAFLRAVADGNRDLLSGALYGFLFKLVGVPRLLRGAVGRWGQMHRGTVFELSGNPDERNVTLRLGYPAHLYTQLSCRAYGEAFRVAIELAGAAGASVRLVEHAPTFALYSAKW